MIHKFLNFLHTNKIDYAIINGVKNLFSKSKELDDVDILFKKNDFKIIESILGDFCKKENFKIVQIYHQEVFAKNIFIYNSASGEILNLDIYGVLHAFNVVYFDETTIFNKRIQYKDVFKIANNQEFFHYLLKKVCKREVSKKTFNTLRKLYVSDKENCKKILAEHLINTSNKIIKSFEEDDYDAFNQIIDYVFKDIKRQSATLNYKIKDKIRIVKRILKPTGISIAFLGSDGSGKTTIIDRVTAAVLPFRKTQYFHLKPIYTKSENSGVTSDPHKFKPYGALKSYVKLLYFFVQYNFGWLKNILPLKISSTLIIFDRYFDDLIVDNKRYRYGGGVTIASFFRRFIKKPSLYFVLTAEPEIIFKRKQEVTFEELKRQINGYRALTKNKNYVHINVDNSPDKIVKEVVNTLMNKMHERL
ncbi:hypothetical protein [uncultured Polaribacter sp.]|uniref:hypothetical protein n=1 Tax=uncultured Polaribacter sp. TaxID=174711 RepID=UPI00262D7E05|nr:hypothetical protein [uncultured Polaribacter sp.]